jgi:hypothetical protein
MIIGRKAGRAAKALYMNLLEKTRKSMWVIDTVDNLTHIKAENNYSLKVVLVIIKGRKYLFEVQ